MGAKRKSANGALRRDVLKALAWVEDFGQTWQEIAERLDLHHGQASGVLSSLHRLGTIERLDEKRNRCSVYVLPAYVKERETIPYGQKSSTDWKKRALALEASGAGDWKARAEAAEATLEAARKSCQSRPVMFTHGQLVGVYSRTRAILHGEPRRGE